MQEEEYLDNDSKSKFYSRSAKFILDSKREIELQKNNLCGRL